MRHQRIIFQILLMGVFLWVSGCQKSDGGSDSDSNSDPDSDSETSTTTQWDHLTGNETTPTIEWVQISAGRFLFGSPPGTPCRSAYSEEQVEVELTRSFMMAATEVTKAQWRALDLPHTPWWNGDTKPVTRVNFFEAAAWCNKLSRLEGLDPCYDLSACENPIGNGCIMDERRNGEACSDTESQPIFFCNGNIHRYPDRYACPGYRLPTTAEWEYAARGGVYDMHTYGGDVLFEYISYCDDQPSLNDIAWYCFNSGGEVHDVGLKRPNAYGLYDMLGNIWEWVDYRARNAPLSDDYPGSVPIIDPVGTENGREMELRGRYSTSTGCMVRPTGRMALKMTSRYITIGFRPVRTILE